MFVTRREDEVTVASTTSAVAPLNAAEAPGSRALAVVTPGHDVCVITHEFDNATAHQLQ